MAKVTLKKSAAVETVKPQGKAVKVTKVARESDTPQGKAAPGAKAEATKAPSIHRGATTGMSVMKYQDFILSRNNTAKLTDEQLLEAMKKEFPNSKGKIFTGDLPTRLSILGAVRRLFNENRHGSQTIAPPDGGVKVFGANGETLEVKRRVRQTKAEPVATTPAAPVAKTPVVKKTKKAA